MWVPKAEGSGEEISAKSSFQILPVMPRASEMRTARAGRAPSAFLFGLSSLTLLKTFSRPTKFNNSQSV